MIFIQVSRLQKKSFSRIYLTSQNYNFSLFFSLEFKLYIMYCHNELAQKIESFILQNKRMRRKLDNHIVYSPSILIIKEPRILQIPTKKASSNPQITLEKKHRPYELEEISSEIKKVKLTKDDGAVNLYNVIFFLSPLKFYFFQWF